MALEEDTEKQTRGPQEAGTQGRLLSYLIS
jgi:hypothetical protein